MGDKGLLMNMNIVKDEIAALEKVEKHLDELAQRVRQEIVDQEWDPQDVLDLFPTDPTMKEKEDYIHMEQNRIMNKMQATMGEEENKVVKLVKQKEDLETQLLLAESIKQAAADRKT